ncbi:SWI/SNF-related matrix-associated actin-dependent regulator of chromatin subfamily E member 1-like isoform X2 [Hydractinia symbiolongicarpus]|uniref:SWI/SNF-related matrix-associated actin-dependent regulator of chromatin subfamily E member 1-like isoform X2 n=1 Tax=Hydractinia symbiolongicarpus TaxID=13093 RepID=UPI00254CB668|nr:SWI/SNF-related matrix-associated actin-dependent regulator of chromatin subfamily E member 1-like isoform X2 [Hydractinia symbiolongicarpus]
MSMNFVGQRAPYPVQFNPGTPLSGRFRSPYQQSPPPNLGMSSSRGHHRDRAVTFMPNDIKIPKPPKQPDKPLPAYMRYSRKVWETVKLQHPEMKMWDIGKLIGEQWRNLPEDERQGFFAEYEVEKSEYQDAMKAYHNSTAYREWLRAKEKAQSAIQDQQMYEKMMGGSMPKEEPRFQLQQIEDDDDAEFAVKHVASSRFQRNHRLISEIFSESTVPDIKTIVTRPRLENLKRQVQSLMQHQRKLEGEIEDMEEKFAAKKQKILDRTAEFEEKVQKFLEIPSPVTDEEKVNDGDSKTDDGDLKTDDSPKDELLPNEVMETEQTLKSTDDIDLQIQTVGLSAESGENITKKPPMPTNVITSTPTPTVETSLPIQNTPVSESTLPKEVNSTGEKQTSSKTPNVPASTQ